MPFGIDGTLAWVTPAGELLQVASCVGNDLIGVEYKRGIEEGKRYYDPEKRLQKAVNSLQGSGYGIGISLQDETEPVDMCWVQNRWPRFRYQYKGLDVILQYYVKSGSLIQQYKIQNMGEKDINFNYIMNSDVCFRRHGCDKSLVEAVPVGISSQRLLLFRSSKVLTRNPRMNVQCEMTNFLNAKRIPVWATATRRDDGLGLMNSSEQPSNARSITSGLKRSISTSSHDMRDHRRETRARLEEDLQTSLLAGMALTEREDANKLSQYHVYFRDSIMNEDLVASKGFDCTAYGNALLVPSGSTQELCAVIRVVKHPFMEHSGANSEPDTEADPMDSYFTTQKKIRSGQKRVAALSEQLARSLSDFRREDLAQTIITKRFVLAKACVRIRDTGAARYHLFTAYLIGVYAFGEERAVSRTPLFEYATFLIEHGSRADGLERLKSMAHTLAKQHNDESMDAFWYKVQSRLGRTYLEVGSFAEAEQAYLEIFSRFGYQHSTTNQRYAAQSLERIAWAQVKLGCYEKAAQTYGQLLKLFNDSGVRSQRLRQILLVNCGYVQRRLDAFEEAEMLYNKAITEAQLSEIQSRDAITAHSGLFGCSSRDSVSIVDARDEEASLIESVSVELSKFGTGRNMSLFEDCRFRFVFERHLEMMLSIACVSVPGKGNDEGMAFIDADPLNCIHEGRTA